MIEVFLDTNVIISEGFLQSPLAGAIFKNPKFLGIKILIPEIIIDEAMGVFSLQTNNKITKYKESRKDLVRFVNLPDVSINLDDMINEYATFLNDLLSDDKIVILPYPKTSVKELVEKSYEAKKPFKDNGKGFKDYVIWKTIKNYCKDNNNSVKKVFITDNKKDFCKKISDETFSLHPDLLDSLEGIKEIPELILSLQDFFDQKLKPSLKRLNSKDLPNFDINKKVKAILEKDILNYNPDGFEGLRFDEELDIISVIGVPIINNPYISEVNENDVLIKVNGTVEIKVQGSMSTEQFYGGDDEIVDFVEDGYCHNEDGGVDHWLVVSQCIQTSFELTISYSKKDKEITNSTINLL